MRKVPGYNESKNGKKTTFIARPALNIHDKSSKDKKTTIGPGTHLHNIILKWIGEAPTQKCGCTSRIRKMNAWGPAGCRKHIDEIVTWLVDEANKRDWWRYIVAVPGSKYFMKRLVLLAIKKAEINLS